ncbi:cellulase/esterase CelE [Lachnospiraceae bacterium]|nr:cellulase/esterase CelE [Lachnospiraceae bacterium]
MWVKMNDERLSYSGRIDWSEEEYPVFIYPCTWVKLRFTGNQLKLHIENHRAYWDNYMGCILDGKQLSLALPKEGRGVLTIPVEQEEKTEHEALIFKRQDACHEVKFFGIELADGARVLKTPEKPARRIEVYGDSVSAGEVAEAVEYTGCEDPGHNGEYSNSWYSYAWMAARKLNAEIHDIAQGGIALMDGTGWFHAPDYIGMETAWDKIRYNLELGKTLDWDFGKYDPQLIIVAFGQNDSNPEDYMKEDFHGEKAEKWRQHYKGFLNQLRTIYPSAYIVCCTTLLRHDKAWDQAIGQVVEKLQDERITRYLFGRNGDGTPGHLRIAEAEEMADELAAYIENLNIEGWK